MGRYPARAFSGGLFLAGLVLVAIATIPAPQRAYAATADVSIEAGGFSPSSLSIGTGTTVTWTNNSPTPQTVSSTLPGSDPDFFNSAWIYAGQSWSHTFANAGTFAYKSLTTNLTGSVTVGGGGSSPTSTPTSTPPQGGGGGGGAGSVSITSGGFVPQTVSISASQTVTWTNNSSTPQTVSSTLPGTDPNFFNSAWIYAGQSWSHTFASGGSFAYRSLTSGLTGTVSVGGGGSQPTSTPTSPPAATATPTATKTPTVPAGATGTATPAPTHTSTASPSTTKTPTAKPGATNTPTPKPGTGGGGSSTPFGPIAAGWNLTTYGGTSNGTSAALAQLGNQWTAVYHWDGTQWERYFRPGTVPGYVNNLEMIASGTPIWILATANIP